MTNAFSESIKWNRLEAENVHMSQSYSHNLKAMFSFSCLGFIFFLIKRKCHNLCSWDLSPISVAGMDPEQNEAGIESK